MEQLVQSSFKRYEKKYILSLQQYEALLNGMKPYMKADIYGKTTNCSIYYDTANWDLVRKSIEKPAYKEKLRVRSYGTPSAKSEVFIEIKKKYDDIVYKRRISIHIANRIIAPMEKNYQKQKQFTADAGHELKTPIAAVAANVELLQRQIGENPWLENIAYENRRMRELVTELLELARNENKMIDWKMTDLSHLVNGAILPLEAAAFEKNVLIETDIPEGITANVDENSVSQLVTILLDNAISHTYCRNGQMGQIQVSLCRDKETVVLQVSNPGEAIPESEQEKLFERFYRADSSHAYTGHYGLGLAIAKAITDAHQGSIGVKCKEGMVTFAAVLPIR